MTFKALSKLASIILQISELMGRQLRLTSARELVQRFQGFSGVKVVVESSGNYWVRLYEVLEENGIRVVLSNPLKTKAIAEAKIKTDRLDASTLADLLRAGLVAESYVPPREVRDRRALLRYRASLVRIRTRAGVDAVVGPLVIIRIKHR